ncbi:serine hydrolase [Plebeiibacterium sediminum]|uniref:Serine hydrolase n=1 Tax=Plebeiibacterium sediminum TaxID=2992112 RepID=A0AAE3SGC5_9BACT|nr:serine hydrolase [Plebeiobacterium sediminum]MCW3788191.1 serine hydrolase [Plebeiobacterium sediminum]
MNIIGLKYKLVLVLFLSIPFTSSPYPIDGYDKTGIKRLQRLKLIIDGTIKDVQPISGALRSSASIKLNLTGEKGDSLIQLPKPDAKFQKAITGLFPNLDESYSIAVVDITKGKPIRYAKLNEHRQYQPGSVGKIAVVTGFFRELQRLYPTSFEKRIELLKSKTVRAGKWALYDEHTVPFFYPDEQKFFKRTVQADDVFTLYEWIDHMLSVSNNGAASVVWREAILMNVFGTNYPALTEEQAEAYFKATNKATLSEKAIAVVNDPLRDLGIEKEDWRLGTFFTKGASSYIPGQGGSTGSPYGLITYLIALERGKVIDEKSSLEIKKLLYMTDRRIRYASSPALINAAVYFKSGSLYKCKPEEGYECGKYKGNVDNYMNSVAIVEHPDGTTYLVALMSNVLKKNSGVDHQTLATFIDRIIKKKL